MVFLISATNLAYTDDYTFIAVLVIETGGKCMIRGKNKNKSEPDIASIMWNPIKSFFFFKNA